MKNDGPERIDALDAMRLLAVLSVVVFHVAMAFSYHARWWAIADPEPSLTASWILLALDGFQLPVLFFIAGCFLCPSLARAESPARFLVAKARRLLVPFAVVVVTLGPVISYIRHLRLGGARTGFGSFLLAQLHSLGDWSMRHLGGWVTAADTTSHVQVWHLWFLPYLFVLFAVATAVLVPARRRMPGWTPPAHARSEWRFLAGLLVAGAVVAAGTWGMTFAASAHTWWSLGPLLVFQPNRLPVHIGLFSVGIAAERLGWRPRPGPLPLLAVSGAAFAALAIALPEYLRAAVADGRTAATPLLHSLLRSGLVVAALVFLSAALARLVTFGAVARTVRRVAPLALDIYVIHLPVVVIAHLLILDAPIGPEARFAAVLLAALAISGLLGHFVVRRRPLLAAGLAACVTVALALVFR